jgi:hypothetical protein
MSRAPKQKYCVYGIGIVNHQNQSWNQSSITNENREKIRDAAVVMMPSLRLMTALILSQYIVIEKIDVTKRIYYKRQIKTTCWIIDNLKKLKNERYKTKQIERKRNWITESLDHRITSHTVLY